MASGFILFLTLSLSFPIAGVLEAEFFENEVNVIPITYPFATSHIWWPINHAEEFNIKFDFRSSRPGAVLAYSDVTTSAGNGFWEVSVCVQPFKHTYMCSPKAYEGDARMGGCMGGCMSVNIAGH